MSGPAPRVRFAPSPTGYFHVGSARTALFNWLVARQMGGTFVLRIEDTDAERNREEWLDGIITALDWLGMAPDEGPYRQSMRTARYDEAIDALWAAGHLYACGCTGDEVQARNAANGIKTPGYDNHCRDLGLGRGEGRALRFRTPDEGTVVVDDQVRGQVEFPCSAMDDFVVVKGSGAPLFALANVVDDIDMAITHIIRGEDLLPTTPKQILLWRALAATGWQVAMGGGPVGDLPVFAHLPMLVHEARKKLSKRKDPVAVELYRDQGYLPEPFVNYLGLLGWSPPDGNETFTMDHMVEAFALGDVNNSPAFFDVAKLTHMNGEYLRSLGSEAFIAAAQPWLHGDAVPWSEEAFDEAVFARMAPLVQERVAILSEVPGMVDFLFLDEAPMDEADWTKVLIADTEADAILQAAQDAYAGTTEWTAARLHEITLQVAETAGKKLGKAQAPIRVAITGRKVGPPLFEALEVLGKEKTLARLKSALDSVGVHQAEDRTESG